MINVIRANFPDVQTEYYRLPSGRWLRFTHGVVDHAPMTADHARRLIRGLIGSQDNYDMRKVRIAETHPRYEDLIAYWMPVTESRRQSRHA